MTFEELRVAAAAANVEFLTVDAEIDVAQQELRTLEERWNEASKKRDRAERAVLEYIRSSVNGPEQR